MLGVFCVAASLVLADRGWAEASYQHVRKPSQRFASPSKHWTNNINNNKTLSVNSLEFDYFKYHRFNQIASHLDQLAREYPDVLRVETIGASAEGRPLKLVKIGRRDADAARAVWVDAGMHAREWVAPATALYVIMRLLQGGLGDGVHWWILPVVNPDGYEYSHTSDRLWRKTRSKIAGSPCRGVDLNRNFDFHFNEVGASDDPCAETFHGGHAFSEPESVAVRDYIWTHRSVIGVYLSLHSFGSMFIIPWAYTSERATDWRDLDSLARRANDAQVRAGGNSYRIGPISSLGFFGSGGSDDWAKGKSGIKFSYSIELFGGRYGFQLPEHEIESVVVPMFEAIWVFGNQAKSSQ